MANAAITIDLNAKIANFETELKRATGSLDRFEKKGTQAAAVFKSAMGGLVGAVSVGAIAAFAKSSIDAADALNDMSQRLGVSVKDLASFKLAAEQSGTSLDGVGAGIARLTRSIGEAEGGNKKLAQALQDLGITARDPKEALFQLADATQRIQDPSQRAALLIQVLGKSYQDLIPLLVQGGAALRESARQSETFADAMARLAPQADQFNDQLALLKNNVAGVSANVLSKLLPSFNEWVGATDTLIERHGVLLGVLSSIGAAALPGVTAGQLSGSVSAQAFSDELNKAKSELAVIQSAQKSGTFGVIQLALYGSREGMERQRTYLQGQIATLESSLTQFRQRQAEAAKGGGGVAGDSSAQIACVASGGTWDGKRCIQKPAAGKGKSKAIDQVEIYNDEMARNAKLIADETNRIAEDYAFMREVDLAQNPAAMAQAWKDAGLALKQDMITPLEQFDNRLEYINELWRIGVIDIETYERATADAFDKAGAKINETNDIAKELGLTFESAFEDAIVSGKKFSDVLKGLAQDILRIVARKAITEPLGNAVGNWAGSLFGSAKGNVFSNAPALSAYSGSVVSSPTVFPFARGMGLMGEAGPEAILPLKRGRDGKLGVAMDGGGGGYVDARVYHIDARGAEAGVEQRIRRAIDDSEDRAVSRAVTQVQSMNQRGQLRLS